MEPLHLELPCDPAALSSLRRLVREWLEGLDPAEAEAAGVVGACSEIAADAIDTAPADTIEVEGAVDGGDAVVRLSVAGSWRIAGRTAVVLRKSLDLGLRARRDL
jgi:hypothetical protein